MPDFTLSLPLSPRRFHNAVVRWQKQHGRHDLPWQHAPTPYHVWLSEVMLQQTQVATVIPYYRRIVARFPTVETLARARLDTLLNLWSGLGYYARARHLHQAAKHIHRHGMPDTMAAWQALPGVGRTTAAAIAVFCHQEKCAILDGNVKRLLARVSGMTAAINTPAGEHALLALAESALPDKRHIRAYTQGLMDLGATVCTPRNPRCGECPLARHCRARLREQTAVIPGKVRRPRKPRKKISMLLLRTDTKILVERRPADGIWGGLWSLPEGDAFPTLRARWEDTLSTSLRATTETTFTHDFTHYRLIATVKICRCPTAARLANCRWLDKNNYLQTGLPAPIKKLFEKIFC